jgi:putative membrane protein
MRLVQGRTRFQVILNGTIERLARSETEDSAGPQMSTHKTVVAIFAPIVFLSVTAAHSGLLSPSATNRSLVRPLNQTRAALTNASDRAFAQLAASGGIGEVDLARLARRKTTNQGVWDFANRIVAHHRQLNTRLSTILRQAAIPVPDMPRPDQTAALRDLEQIDGDIFDARYMWTEVANHEKMAQLLMSQIKSGQNTELQDFATDTLPIVLEHLAIARDILSQSTPGALPVGANAN